MRSGIGGGSEEEEDEERDEGTGHGFLSSFFNAF
jgi:hypothetical protein